MPEVVYAWDINNTPLRISWLCGAGYRQAAEGETVTLLGASRRIRDCLLPLVAAAVIALGVG